MVKSDNFDILGQKVFALLTHFKELKAKNKELESSVKRLEMEAKSLAEKVSEHDKEKLAVKSRVEEIINKIEELEVGE